MTYNVKADDDDNAEVDNDGSAAVYNPKSTLAGEFINHGEIVATLRYAAENKHNTALAEQLIEKALLKKGLTHREAAVVLACDEPAVTAKLKEAANRIKKEFYGNRIVLFAPLYLSNYCVNGCEYCPYHAKNKNIQRKKLTQAEIAAEVTALQDMGHKRLAVETGEDPVNNPIEYILESIETIYGVKHKNGAIRRVNINIAATTAENYRKLHDAQIGTYILFQETYNRAKYKLLHPTGPKSNYDYHTEAHDRAVAGGIEDVGLGVLFGLSDYLYEFVGLLMHAEHLEAVHGVGPHTISVPRVKPADGIDPADFSEAAGSDNCPDDIFERIVAAIRVSVPYTGMIISTRESEQCRKRVLPLGISQISGASRTSVGGYIYAERDNTTTQFDVSDTRSLDEVVNWLIKLGYVPSFCTACYRDGRVGGNFMKLLKGGHIAANCQANSIITLREYLNDYGSEDTVAVGNARIDEEIMRIPDLKMREYIQRVTSAEFNDVFV